MFDSDSIMSCNTAIPSISNTSMKIYLRRTILGELASTYYADNNDTFGILFQLYTSSDVDNTYHPSIVK